MRPVSRAATGAPSADGPTLLRECRSSVCAGARMTVRGAAPRLGAMATLAHPSAQFSATLRVHLANQPGAFAALAAAVAQHDALLDAIDLVRVENGTKVRDVTVLATDAGHIARIVDTVRELDAVAVVSDGSAVLGLGDVGPEAAIPVMEGKAVLFKEFAGVDAFPICLDTRDPDEIVATVKAFAPTFGGINLEDISSPRCFEI